MTAWPASNPEVKSIWGSMSKNRVELIKIEKETGKVRWKGLFAFCLNQYFFLGTAAP